MVEDEIKEILERENKAWETKNLKLLLSIFHPDMVWVWPKDNTALNPIDWRIGMGKFNKERWGKIYSGLFQGLTLIHNNRKILKIEVSNEDDGALAVVDVDTLWKDQNGNEMHWLGRASKTYVKTNDGWKMIAHTGLLNYPK